MTIRKAKAAWSGDLKTGQGMMELGSGAFKGSYSFRSRMESGDGTNPEELLGAAHAGCFSMQLSAMLAAGGNPPTRLETTAEVSFSPDGAGFSITGIALITEAEVPGLDSKTFLEKAEEAKKICPVSKALAAVPITLNAKLLA